MNRALVAIIFAIFLASSAHAQQQVEGRALNRGTINGSITITTGNTFQTITLTKAGAPVSSSQAIQSLTIENNNASDNCWLFIGSGAPTEAKSILLLPGGSYTRYWPYIPSDTLQATCASNSDTLYVDNQ